METGSGLVLFARCCVKSGKALCRDRPWPCFVSQVLREVWKSTLPVEVVYQGSAEMDAATVTGLQKHFAPLRVYDIQATQHPVADLYTRYALKQLGWTE